MRLLPQFVLVVESGMKLCYDVVVMILQFDLREVVLDLLHEVVLDIGAGIQGRLMGRPLILRQSDEHVPLPYVIIHLVDLRPLVPVEPFFVNGVEL